MGWRTEEKDLLKGAFKSKRASDSPVLDPPQNAPKGLQRWNKKKKQRELQPLVTISNFLFGAYTEIA